MIMLNLVSRTLFVSHYVYIDALLCVSSNGICDLQGAYSALNLAQVGLSVSIPPPFFSMILNELY